MAACYRDIVQFCRDIPKVELHAHLNGSISVKTMNKLYKDYNESHKQNHYIDKCMVAMTKGENRTMEECFQIFGMIHKLVDNIDAVAMVIKDVIEEFNDDGVYYLELRSTPRDVPTTGMTKRQYIDTVLLGIQQCQQAGINTIVRLLLSIDRRVSKEVAMEIVDLAEEYKKSSDGIVLGVDLSGDPKVDASHLISVLKYAKDRGLKIAIHIAEVASMTDDEALLQILPDRIGHGTCLHPDYGGSDHLVSLMKEYQKPLELCLSSNVMCQSVKSFDNHHFKFWYSSNHPLAICTDDKGVYATTLSEEYSLAAKTFDLSKEQIWQLSYQSINYIFEADKVKETLKQLWEKKKQELNF